VWSAGEVEGRAKHAMQIACGMPCIGRHGKQEHGDMAPRGRIASTGTVHTGPYVPSLAVCRCLSCVAGHLHLLIVVTTSGFSHNGAAAALLHRVLPTDKAAALPDGHVLGPDIHIACTSQAGQMRRGRQVVDRQVADGLACQRRCEAAVRPAKLPALPGLQGCPAGRALLCSALPCPTQLPSLPCPALMPT